MSTIRDKTQTIIREFDNETSFITLLSAAMFPYLEQPVNRARFFNYNKELELYFAPKDLNRFSRLKELFRYVGKLVKSKKLTGFERILKAMREHEIMVREKEGPSEGIAWKGFGGVHSHYDLTPIGTAVLILQTTLRCSAVDFRQVKLSEGWDQAINSEMELITSSLVERRLKIRDSEKHFFARRLDASFITQRVFEIIACSSKRVKEEEIREFIWDKAGEEHIGELPGAFKRLKPLLHSDGVSYRLNDRGKAVRIGYANVIVEVALQQKDTELVHHMISAKSLEAGATNIISQFAHWF